MSGTVDIATLGIEVRSDGVLVASDRLRQLQKTGGQAEQSVKGLGSATSTLTSYAKVAAAALATWKLGDLIKDSTLLAARVETLGVVMRIVGNNSGYTTKQIDAVDASIRKQGITMQASRETVTRMAQAQIDLSKSADLARVAQDAAVIAGTNSSEAFTRMIYGIQSGQTEILRTIGINVNFEQSYKALATQLGKKTDALTEDEKTQARVNAVMERSVDIAGAYEASMGTAGKQITSMSRYTEDLKVQLGEAFTPLLSDIIRDVTLALKGMNTVMGEGKGTSDAFGRSLQDAYDAIKTLGNHALWMGAKTGQGLTWEGPTNRWFEGKARSLDDTSSIRYGLNQARSNPGVDPQALRAQVDAENRRIEAAERARKAREEEAKSAAAATEAERRATAAVREAAAEVERYTATIRNLHDQRAINAPLLDSEVRAQRELRIEYDNLITQFPKRKAQLEQEYQLSKSQLDTLQAISRVEKEIALGELEREAAAGGFGFTGSAIRTMGEFKAPGREKKPTTFQYGSISDNYSLLGGDGFYQKDVEQLEKANAEKLAIEKRFNDEMMAMKLGAAEQALGLSRTLFGDSKGIALAMLAFEKVVAAQRIITSAEVAKMGVIASNSMLGPAAPAAWAAQIAMIEGMRAISLGVLAASAVAEGAQIMGGKALGGNVEPGNAYPVGEWGREMFVPDTPGKIVPNHEVASQGGGVSVTLAFNIAPGVNSETIRNEFMAMMPMIEQRAVRAVQSAIDSGKPIARSVGRG